MVTHYNLCKMGGYVMAIVLLILIGLALLAGVIFLAYKFGDTVVEMFAQLAGLPKGDIAMLLFAVIFAVISTVITVKIIKHLKRFD